MNDKTSSLRLLAEAASVHALEHYTVRIGLSRASGSLVQVDKILDKCRLEADHPDLESLILCYGAWLGEWIITHHGGQWIGLSESFAPRLLIHREIVSPLDAVRRRLTSPNAPMLQQLVAQIAAQLRIQTPACDLDANRAAWDMRASDLRFVHRGPWSKSKDEALSEIDPWILEEGSVEDKRFLCLAAGGGKHGPMYAVAGAEVVVVDFCLSLLQIDQSIAEKNQLRLRTIQSTIEDLSSLESASFDCVVQPVSSCYIQNIERVYLEIARVLCSGGLYVSQHKTPYSLQADPLPTSSGYSLRVPCTSGTTAIPMAESSAFRESDMTEYIHSIETLVGGLCRCGFVVEDLTEPPHSDAWAVEGTPEHRAQFVPPYLKIKARRK